MKIALVHDFLIKNGGAEKVLQVFHVIFPDAPIYTLLYDEKGTRGAFKDYNIIPSGLNKAPSFLRRHSKYFLAHLPKAIEEFDFSDYDCVISLSNSFAHGILTKPTTCHICYCYSPARYLWDWYHQYLIENHFGFGVRGLYLRSLLHKIRLWDQISASRVDVWATQSQITRSRINKYYRQDATVIYPPVDIPSNMIMSQPNKKYYLIVSRLEPYKKIDLAINAFNKINKPLVIIGEGSDRSRLEHLANQNIKFIGWQSDEKVIEYMRSSYAFIFPGEEDFGLTPVESMACGKPVIAYRKGGVTETVIENKTGVFFDHQNEKSLIDSIKYLELNYAKFEPKVCRQIAEKFSKERFAKEITDFVERSFADYQRGKK